MNIKINNQEFVLQEIDNIPSSHSCIMCIDKKSTMLQSEEGDVFCSKECFMHFMKNCVDIVEHLDDIQINLSKEQAYFLLGVLDMAQEINRTLCDRNGTEEATSELAELTQHIKSQL